MLRQKDTGETAEAEKEHEALWLVFSNCSVQKKAKPSVESLGRRWGWGGLRIR